MKNKSSKIFLFTLFCMLPITVTTFGMKNERNKPFKLSPEIQGYIVTIILELYLNERGNLIDAYEKDLQDNTFLNHIFYKEATNTILNKIIFWIHCTRFKPIQDAINLNCTCKKGNTLLHYATKATLQELDNYYWQHVTKTMPDPYDEVNLFTFTQYLLEHKANPNIQNNNGKTAFWCCLGGLPTQSTYYISSKEKREKLTRLFLTAGADPKVSSQDNDFICILATKEYSPLVAQILALTNIKDHMNKQNEYGATPVSTAAASLNLEFLHILADAGADLTSKDAWKTPLEYALACQDDFMEKIYSTEHIDTVIDFLKKQMNNNQ